VEVLSGAVRIYEPAELLEISVTPLGTPIVIPASGGSFSYNVQAIAPLDVNAGFDFWTMVILPDGSIYGPLFLRKGILLAGGTMIQRTLSQYVPASAPAGTYTFYAYAGVYDNGEAWYDEFFFFQKEGSENTTGKGSWATSGWDAEQSGDLTEEGILGEYKLFQSYPNPFNTSTILQIELPQKSQVNLELYNINGQLVRTIYSGIQNAGSFQFRFEASDLPSGVYFCKMKAESLESANKFSGIGKLILLK
jgi:hypothetical protein